MTIKELVTKIAKEEGRKHEASVGDLREIVGLISDVLYAEIQSGGLTELALLKNGKRRAKRKKK